MLTVGSDSVRKEGGIISREINYGKDGGTFALITEASFLSGKADIL